MAEMPRQLTQAEIDRILFLQSKGLDPRGRVPVPSIQNLQQRTSGAITPIAENPAQLAAAGAGRVGQFLNQILPNAQQVVAANPLNLEALFPTTTAPAQVTIPTGFNFAPKQQPTGEITPGGLQTNQVNLDQLLRAIKPADVLGVTGAQQAYTDVGMGKAPNPMDVLDMATLGAIGYGAGKAGLKATKGMPIGLSIQDVSKASEFVPNVPAGQELVVMHNLSPQNLQFANKLGGLPIPSLGVGKTSVPYEGFGEITLIAPKEFAIPSAKNPVYRADAYTKRFPAIDYQFNKKSENQFNNIFADLKTKLPDSYKYDTNRIMQNWKDRDYSQLFQSKFLEEKGLLPEKSQFKDDYAFSSEVSARVNNLNNEYSDWLTNFDNRLSELGAIPKEKLYKGMTYSGKRMYRDATLDNIVKEMKGGAATENWHYGAGNVRAAVSPKFRKLSEIQENRGLLVDNKTMGEIKDQTNKAYSDLYTRLKAINPKYSADDALLEIAQTKNMGVLAREYDKTPDALKADIKAFLDSFKGMPTEFFEVKPQRAVKLEEFRGAIIPKNAPQSTRDILQQRGIKDVYEYETPEERASLMQKFGKEMFVAAPVGTGLLGIQQERK